MINTTISTTIRAINIVTKELSNKVLLKDMVGTFSCVVISKVRKLDSWYAILGETPD